MTLQKYNGAFLVNKEKGFTSHDIVFKLRKILKTPQIGHTGTLDPMACGMLICLVGPAVKLLPYLGNENKEYQVGLELGKTSDTLDSTGNITVSRKFLELSTLENFSSEQISSEISGLQGEFHWEIPLYSAKKINGQKLYEYARVNKDIVLPLKLMKFWDVQGLRVEIPFIKAKLKCSKGSFIRSWVHELGKRLDTGAVMTELVRTGIDDWKLEYAQTLSELSEEISRGVDEPKSYIPVMELIKNQCQLELMDIEYERIKNGLISYQLQNRLESLQRQNLSNENWQMGNRQIENLKTEMPIFCTKNNELAAIIETQNNHFVLKRVFVH